MRPEVRSHLLLHYPPYREHADMRMAGRIFQDPDASDALKRDAAEVERQLIVRGRNRYYRLQRIGASGVQP